MECLGQSRLSGACNVSEVPDFSFLDMDDDEGEVVIGIRPKSSPLPRRKSSFSDEDSEPEVPFCGSRRVSFADAKGLSLVQVKEFDTWDVPKLPGYDSSEGDFNDAEGYFLSPLTFSRPLSSEELFVKVQEQKVELETIALIPGTTILKGVIRVFNISYSKAVYIRTTLDSWSSHFDLLAEYIPGSSDSLTDCFSFKLTLVPPFGEQGARVEFCLRYETSVGTFWSNNNNMNFVLFCHQRVKEKKEEPKKENVSKKSCLKMVSQNFSTVENISTISTDVSKHNREEVDAMKAKQICCGQSGTSEEDRQKLLIENRQNCSRRSRRKAARMARVRDYFAQRDGDANDTRRDESPPEAKQAAQEEIPQKENSGVQAFSEGSSKSEGAQVVPESVEICNEPHLDVLHDASAAHECTSKSEPEKSERISLADSLTGSESATDIPDSPLCLSDEPSPAACQNIKSFSKAEESSQEQGMSHDCTCNIVAEAAASVFSAESTESLIIQPNSLTFGTVMAPLYHQVFGRVGSKSQSAGDWRNPIKATLNGGDLIQSFPPTEREETSVIPVVPTEDRGNTDKVQGKLIQSQESNHECFDATSPPFVTTNDHAETLQDPVEIIHPDQKCPKTSEVLKPFSGDTEVHQDAVNTINTDLLNPQIPSESLQGEVQEESVTPDHHSQTTAETAHSQLPEQTCAQIRKTNLDETLPQCGTQEAMATLKTSVTSLQLTPIAAKSITDEADQQASSSKAKHCERVDESYKHYVAGKTAVITTTNAVPEEAKVLHDLNNHSNNLAPEKNENCCISCFESVKKKDLAAPQISLETQEEASQVEEGNKVMSSLHEDEPKHAAAIKVIGEVADSLTKAVRSDDHIRDEIFMKLIDMNILKDEANMASRNERHHGIKTTVSKQENFSSTDTAEEKNWEMMVEEEEKNILTDEEKSNVTSLKAEATEAVEKDLGEQLEDAGMETASENRTVTEEKMVGQITAERAEESKAVDADVLGDGQRTGLEESGETVVGKDGEEGWKELEYTQAKKRKKTAGVTEEEHEETMLEEEKHTAHNIQEEQGIEREEEMETDFYTDNEAGDDWEYQVKPKEENVDGEIPGYKEEIPVEEMGQSEVVGAGSQSTPLEDWGNDVGCPEEKLDISQNKTEYSSPALVNDMHDMRVFDKGNTGEGQNAHITTERHLHKEGNFQTSKNGIQDLSKPMGVENQLGAADGDSCFFADEPEGDQPSHDSGSADSDSDDEVELYMHCLRAVHTGPQTLKDRNNDAGFILGKRPSVSRSKLLSTPMPSISESLDEDQHLSRLQDSHGGAETADVPPTAATQPLSSGQGSISRRVPWWLHTFSFSNITKTLLYATLLVVFVVVAYHYDFLACFGLYLISVVWLCRQGERQPVKNNRLG